MYAETNRERSEAHKMAEGHARNEAEVWLRHDTLVYAQHGHELMGCKSPVGGPPLNCDLTLTTSEWQGLNREVWSGGSR